MLFVAAAGSLMWRVPTDRRYAALAEFSETGAAVGRNECAYLTTFKSSEHLLLVKENTSDFGLLLFRPFACHVTDGESKPAMYFFSLSRVVPLRRFQSVFVQLGSFVGSPVAP